MTPVKELTYNQAISELESILRTMQSDDCDIDRLATLTRRATELIADMAEVETTPNVVTKYLGQFSCEVLEPVGIEYRTKRTGKSRLIRLMKNDGNDGESAI